MNSQRATIEVDQNFYKSIIDLELQLFSQTPSLVKAWRLLSLYQVIFQKHCQLLGGYRSCGIIIKWLKGNVVVKGQIYEKTSNIQIENRIRRRLENIKGILFQKWQIILQQKYSVEMDQKLRGRKFFLPEKPQRQIPSKSLSPSRIKQNQANYKKFKKFLKNSSEQKDMLLESSPQKQLKTTIIKGSFNSEKKLKKKKKVSFQQKIERGRQLLLKEDYDKHRSDSPQRHHITKRSKSR